jgi:pyruvate dehydrogenase E2 component (dihydrolipoamide acetyltransferase)
MAIDITIPRLGWNMDEGVFIAWHKADGDLVKAGEPLFSLESDKAAQEIESLDSGRLQISPTGPKPGQTVAVGTVIGSLLGPAEAAQGLGAGAGSPSHASDLSSDHSRSSPRARRRARELRIDWRTLPGTGRSGRVRDRDVLAAASRTAPQTGLPHMDARDGEDQVVPVDPTRRAIAERMMQGAHGSAPVTLSTSIDVTNLVNLRQQFKAAASLEGLGQGTGSIGYTDILVKLAALALERHPALNSRWDGERILLLRSIHIGVAVDTDRGLVAPVIRDVPRLTLREIAQRSADLVDRARRRALTFQELQGGTFSITNLGPFGIDAFTPIINAPQCAVLGIGRISRQPVCLQDQLAFRDRMTLSLTFDHRIVDGGPAARFLQTLSGLLGNPSPWLMP